MQSRSHPDDQEFEMQSSAHLADGVGNSSAPPQIIGQSITPPTTNSEPELSPKISPNSPKQPPLQEQQHHSGLINGDIKQEYRDIKQDYRDIKLEDAHEYRGKKSCQCYEACHLSARVNVVNKCECLHICAVHLIVNPK